MSKPAETNCSGIFGLSRLYIFSAMVLARMHFARVKVVASHLLAFLCLVTLAHIVVNCAICLHKPFSSPPAKLGEGTKAKLGEGEEAKLGEPCQISQDRLPIFPFP
jgi:hypothetical protein